MATILVVAEQSNGHLKKATLSALTAAQQVAKNTGANIAGVVIGAGAGQAAQDLAAYGIPVHVGSLPHPAVPPESFDLITFHDRNRCFRHFHFSRRLRGKLINQIDVAIGASCEPGSVLRFTARTNHGPRVYYEISWVCAHCQIQFAMQSSLQCNLVCITD